MRLAHMGRSDGVALNVLDFCLECKGLLRVTKRSSPPIIGRSAAFWTRGIIGKQDPKRFQSVTVLIVLVARKSCGNPLACFFEALPSSVQFEKFVECARK